MATQFPLAGQEPPWRDQLKAYIDERAGGGGGNVTGEELPGDEFSVRFDDGDVFFRANEDLGVFSRVQATAVEIAEHPGEPLFQPLPPESGMLWAITDEHGLFGRRSDGTLVGVESPDTPTTAAPLVKIGDSLSAGWTDNTGLTRSTTNLGIGSQNSAQIAARVGGAPATVTFPDNKIPATTSPVTVSVSINLLTRVGATQTRSQEVVIAGVKGTLTGVDEGNVYTFARASAGSAVPVRPGTPIQTGFTWRDLVPVVGVGRNDGSTAWASPAPIIGRIRAILDWSRHGADGIVLTIPPWETETTGTATRTALDAANAAIFEAFGSRVFDWAAHLRSADTLASVGITPTATDLQNITDGVTPASFRSDAGHFNAPAYRAINTRIETLISVRGI